jgi:hypothetical protein
MFTPRKRTGKTKNIIFLKSLKGKMDWKENNKRKNS